jgi:hypothetical protein
MRYALALESMEPGHHIAWVQALPGCFSSAPTQAEAVAGAPGAILAHLEWLQARGRPSALAGEPVETQVVEVFQAFPSPQDPDYIVNAFFEDDRRVLDAQEIDFALWFLEHSRRELMQAVSRFGPDQFALPIAPAPRDSLARVLNHLAHAEWWYFDRLDLADPLDWPQLPDDPLIRLEQVRAHARRTLPKLAGEGRVTLRTGEQWSGRKLLRRMLWHERDHTLQIAAVDPSSLR